VYAVSHVEVACKHEVGPVPALSFVQKQEHAIHRSVLTGCGPPGQHVLLLASKVIHFHQFIKSVSVLQLSEWCFSALSIPVQNIAIRLTGENFDKSHIFILHKKCVVVFLLESREMTGLGNENTDSFWMMKASANKIYWRWNCFFRWTVVSFTDRFNVLLWMIAAFNGVSMQNADNGKVCMCALFNSLNIRYRHNYRTDKP